MDKIYSMWLIVSLACIFIAFVVIPKIEKKKNKNRNYSDDEED